MSIQKLVDNVKTGVFVVCENGINGFSHGLKREPNGNRLPQGYCRLVLNKSVFTFEDQYTDEIVKKYLEGAGVVEVKNEQTPLIDRIR